MSRQSPWASKVAALIQGGNTEAALAQIKVAPSVALVFVMAVLVVALTIGIVVWAWPAANWPKSVVKPVPVTL